jgi:hypothetical protein
MLGSLWNNSLSYLPDHMNHIPTLLQVSYLTIHMHHIPTVIQVS